ncbi:MAG: amidohydrolase family protein [Acidobacteriota bacterium]|nr:amidohydrolase family protein [Acidobacteriota bacterium]
MTHYRAAWVCPIDRSPIKDGIVTVDAGRIAAIRAPFDSGRDRDPVSPLAQGRPVRDLGRVVLMPGLINAHIHLELSWLRGRVPPAHKFTDWVKQLVALRRGIERLGDPDVVAPIRTAIGELRDSGTVAVGDISNSLASVAPMAEARLDGIVFHELLGFKERDARLVERSLEARNAVAASGIRTSIAPHAPYSTSPELFRAIRAAVDESPCRITSIHLGESPQEVELLATGTGSWRSMLEIIGAWRDDWQIPGCGPVEYLDGMALIDARTLVIHGVQLEDGALRRLAQIGATLVTCPRSNQWVGVGAPPIERFYQSGVAVAVGTDSLASVADLNLFGEMKEMRWLAPGVPAAKILESATLVGARALGLDHELGTLTPGKRAEIIAVAVPEGVDDVEEYLLSGIQPSQISWIES